jgi:hypothetical protein
MTLILKPKGRGNWRPMTMRLEGFPWADCMWFAGNIHVGATITVGLITFRICKVSV